MNKLVVIAAALLLTAGGTLWAAVSLPSVQKDKETRITSEAPAAETMRRGRGRHVCGTRFCGWHGHHHGHVWCDGRDHWYCHGHD